MPHGWNHNNAIAWLSIGKQKHIAPMKHLKTNKHSNKHYKYFFPPGSNQKTISNNTYIWQRCVYLITQQKKSVSEINLSQTFVLQKEKENQNQRDIVRQFVRLRKLIIQIHLHINTRIATLYHLVMIHYFLIKMSQLFRTMVGTQKLLLMDKPWPLIKKKKRKIYITRALCSIWFPHTTPF